MENFPKAVDYVAQIDPYDAGKPLSGIAKEIGIRTDRLMLLNANENPLGVSEAAKKAVTEELTRMNRYPDGSVSALRKAVAERLYISPDQVIHGNGSDELLSLVASAYLEPGKRAVYSQYSFSVYQLVSQARGATCVEVPVKDDFGYDLTAILKEAQEPNTGVVFLTNPNNPTGLLLDKAELHVTLEQIPSDVLVVLDEAYQEFAPGTAFEDPDTLIEQFPNVLITRTFSKAYGLAGFRVGYGVANATIIETLNRIRGPFNVNRLAQVTALAALEDESFLNQTVANNQKERENFENELERMGVKYIPSQTNFVMFEVPDAPTMIKRLREAGILVRSLKSYGLDKWIRVSIGKSQDMACLLDVFFVTMRLLRHGYREE